MSLHRRARDLFAELQEAISSRLEEIDGVASFKEDSWQHVSPHDPDSTGGGRTRTIERGRIFEKGGVNLAEVGGRLTERLAARLEVEAQRFEATGISLVIHPLSPMVPTVHMNLRHLQLEGGRSWFGGGADLTPYYLHEEDAVHFHRVWKEICEAHAPGSYARYKKACDDYFRVKHRGEARGIGGIFFDYLEDDPEGTLGFVERVGRGFLEAYVPIVERRAGERWWDHERNWQLVRRGRYVEFNLVHDRGTLFGLETGGRTESILMSLPPLVRWDYDRKPAAGSREADLVAVLREPRDWV